MEDNISLEGESAIIRINGKLYPIGAVYSAAYVFLDKAYLILDGDPEKEIIVKIKPKQGNSSEELAREFLNELLNYADYEKRARETKTIRQILLGRALLTSSAKAYKKDKEFDDLIKELEEDKEYLEEPEDIAAPWEDKHECSKKQDPDKAE